MAGNLFRAMALAWLLAAGLAGCASGPPPVRERLSDGDVAMMQATIRSALETAQTGAGVNWQNPQTGHRGTVTPVRTVEKDGEAPCRDYQITATAGDDTEIGYDRACRNAAGAWVSDIGEDPRDILLVTQRRRQDAYYDSWRCRWPSRTGYYDPWCRSPRSGVTIGVGTSF